jgi:hypothetical protein
MSQALWMRLRDVAWSDFETSTGNGERIPRLLQDISSRKIPRAIKACHMVWKQLCSGGIHPAAEPTLPFLIELSQLVTADVKLEILDILKSCAFSLSNLEEKEPWQEQPWTTLAQALPIFRKMLGKGRGEESEFISIAVEAVIEILEKDSHRKSQEK